MAENLNKISQIKIGDITYDICDVTARDSISSLKIIQKFSPNYADGSQAALVTSSESSSSDRIFCTYPIEDYITQVKNEIPDYDSDKYNCFSICQGFITISNVGQSGILRINLGFYMADDNSHVVQTAYNNSYMGTYSHLNLCSGLIYMKNFCTVSNSRSIQGIDIRLAKKISGTTAVTDTVSAAYISITTFITSIL
jgi:hypothetical protein